MISCDKKQILKEELNKTLDVLKEGERICAVHNLYTNTFEVKKDYDMLYAFATEDMSGYYPEFGHPKTILTVGSSGDQILNAVKLGAEKIDVFDLNRLAKRQCELKIASAKTLKAEELWENFNSFDEDLFAKVLPNMKEEDRIYWEALVEFIGLENLSELYPYQKIPKELFYQINPYAEIEGYKKLQEDLKRVEINYYDSDLYSLPKLLGNNTYDAMNFSNIYEYLNYGKNTNYDNALKYYQFIMEEMYPRLNENGTIMLAYMYAFSENTKRRFEELWEKYPEKLERSEPITTEQLDFYLEGYTLQNYSYKLIQDIFEKENIRKVPTSHVIFGSGIDKSQDVALCLKK